MLRVTKPLIRKPLCKTFRNNVFRLKSTSLDQSKNIENESHEVQFSDSLPKLPAREPLVKNFFVGVVDKELLAYPEVISREDMISLQDKLLPIKSFFNEVNIDNAIDTTVIDSLKQLGLYGLNVTSDYEGGGHNLSASLIASEPETENTSLALSLLSHRTVIDFLSEVGTQEQQQKYLGQLASGDLIATEAMLEYEAPKEDLFNTKAEYSPETNEWILNGEKAYVVTGPLHKDFKQLFLVIAQTQKSKAYSQNNRNSTIFLVESKQAGIKLGTQHPTIGCKGTLIGTVKFDQVKLSDSSVVGIAHDGNKYAEQLIRAGRLRSSLLGLTLAKRLLNNLAQYSVSNTQCGLGLKELEVVRMHLSKAMCSTYAMESMIYHTAGLWDEFQRPDVILEASITKYYTLKELYDLVRQSLNVIGAKSLHAGQFTELCFRDSAQLYTQGESMDSLSMFIALSGLQHAGQITNDVVRKSRNPLFHPGHIFGKFLETTSIDNPNTKMELAENLHPTLAPAAQCIEHSVARLQMSVDLMFTRHGNAVVERHNEMQRLADIATTIYAMYASASRASRSYCIGLPLADHEMLTASAICTQGRDYVKSLCTELFNGHYVNNDNNLLRLASQVAKSKGFFAVHPLTYNF